MLSLQFEEIENVNVYILKGIERYFVSELIENNDSPVVGAPYRTKV